MCYLDKLNEHKDFVVTINNNRYPNEREMYGVQVKYKDNLIFNQGKFLCPAESKIKVKKMYEELLKIELNKLNINIKF